LTSSSFAKEETFTLANKLIEDFSKNEKEQLIKFVKEIQQFVQKKIKAKDLELSVLLFDKKITDAGFEITGAM